MSILVFDDRLTETIDQDYLLLEPADNESDDELLAAFVAQCEDWAFEQLVTRHASLVMAVCRRVLANEQDAEDAFQATFLVLARKARSLRQAKSLPAWLHKTAFHIALRAKAQRVRRRELPLEVDPMLAAESLSEIAAEFNHSVLDEELNRLPERYRLPLFLCCLEGKSREEAAQQLGWRIGSLKGRLERGRQLLRQRLLLRGVSLGLVLWLVSRAPAAMQAAPSVTPSLVASTVHAGLQHAAGQSLAGVVSPNVISLAHGSFLIMSLTTKIVLCGCLAVGLLATGLSSLLVPAAVGGEGEGSVVVLTSDALNADASQASSFVALLADDEKKDEPRAEGERREPREGQGDARREPREGEREVREGEAANRRTVREGEREPAREVRDGERPRGEGFRPTTANEEALFQMIQQLQREVAELRRILQGRAGDGRDAIREGDSRREGEREVRDGERRADAPRDGERAKDAPRDGERAKDAPRDGERAKDAPRDGERAKDAPRDGERAKDAPREGDAPR